MEFSGGAVVSAILRLIDPNGAPHSTDSRHYMLAAFDPALLMLVLDLSPDLYSRKIESGLDVRDILVLFTLLRITIGIRVGLSITGIQKMIVNKLKARAARRQDARAMKFWQVKEDQKNNRANSRRKSCSALDPHKGFLAHLLTANSLSVTDT